MASISPSPKSPRRSLLFVPGDSRRKIDKITALAADAFILDLEDSIAVREKENARQSVYHALKTNDFGAKERLVRINAPITPFFEADLKAVGNGKPDGIVIPKVDSAEVLVQIDQELTALEESHGWYEGEIRLLALIETAAGIMNLKEIAQSTARLDALLFGAEDLAADMGLTRTKQGWEMFYGRSAVVMAAAAYGLQAIDTVFIDIRDLEGLREDSNQARQMGYNGKMAVHPGQIETINDLFSPSLDELAQAQRLLREAKVHEIGGSGVFTLDGRMVDAPMIRNAERLVQRAQLCGLL